MPIGVGAAMLIGSGIAGGAAVGAAKIQSNAAKKAAQQQQQGTDRALAVQQQANAPYLQLGQQAASRLGNLTASAQPYTQQFGGPQGSNGYQAMPTLGSLGQMPPQGPPAGAGAMPPPGGMGQPGGYQAMPPGRGQGPQGGQPPMGGLVTLQAPPPSREVVRMPDGPDVQMLIGKGARRIG